MLAGLKTSGGEGGILLPPLPASAGESYSSAIIPRVLVGYRGDAITGGEFSGCRIESSRRSGIEALNL
jgi:hypothetical protein